ncbi:MAG TPA: 1-acyl-sn-glycerol-3-phosphate acyltransferase, partial [Bryobacteraceae bacterium]|nr:1-acyl-sn-glycerol-3-phosphate acyltransferase [Bryobacteraceae bacterium]
MNAVPGVVDSAVVGTDRVGAVLVLADGADAEAAVRTANEKLEDHQKVRSFHVWPGDELPRTEGTRKLKRRELLRWLESGGGTPSAPVSGDEFTAVLSHFVRGRSFGDETTMEELGLSSLERVEMLLALERRLGATIDEAAYACAQTVGDLRSLALHGSAIAVPDGRPLQSGSVELFEFPSWNRSRWAQGVRRINLPLWVLPLARVFTWVRSEGLENLEGLEPPVIFAPNHQSHLDVPAMMLALPAKWRYRIGPAMSKEFFQAHFYPERHSVRERITNGLNYYLSTLMFNAFPFPQREAGARQTMRYAGELTSEGWCIVIFPEGKLSDTGEIAPFQPGVGLMASRLDVPVVPVRLRGLTEVLHRSWHMARPGRVTVHFGRPLRLKGDDYAALASQVEDAVRAL